MRSSSSKPKTEVRLARNGQLTVETKIKIDAIALSAAANGNTRGEGF